MSRPAKNVAIFEIGDRVKHISDPKSEGVVVHYHSSSTDSRVWSVHWHNMKPGRGVYTSTEIQKYY